MCVWVCVCVGVCVGVCVWWQSLSSQLCCLCQREKGRLCLCRVVVQEGAEQDSDPSIGCLATVTLPTHSAPFPRPSSPLLPLHLSLSYVHLFFFRGSRARREKGEVSKWRKNDTEVVRPTSGGASVASGALGAGNLLCQRVLTLSRGTFKFVCGGL